MPLTPVPPPLIHPSSGAGLRAHLVEDAENLARAADFRGFYDALDHDEGERVTRLWAAVRCIEEGEVERAATHAERLIRGMPDEDDASGSSAVRTFAEALLARVRQASTAGGNLYLDARPPGAQLRAFELLRLRTPLIAFAYAAGNRALLDCVEQGDDVTIIDVGVGAPVNSARSCVTRALACCAASTSSGSNRTRPCGRARARWRSRNKTCSAAPKRSG